MKKITKKEKITLAETTGDAQILNRFAKSVSEDIRASVARNPNITTEAIELLRKDESSKVRFYITKNINLTNEMIKEFLNDKKSHIRMSIVHHPKISNDLLETLTTSPDSNIREAIASDSRTNIESLRKLMFDPMSDVRAAVAHNNKITQDMLDILLTDSSNNVIDSIAQYTNNIKAMKTLSKSENDYTRLYVAKNYHVTKEILEELANDKRRLVYLVAKNKLKRVKMIKEIISTIESLSSHYDEEIIKEDVKDKLSISRNDVENALTDKKIMFLEDRESEKYIRVASLITIEGVSYWHYDDAYGVECMERIDNTK